MRHRLKLDRLAQVLAASKLSQNHWALKLGLSRGHWSDIINGHHPFPSAKTRQRMVELFGVPAEELFVVDGDARSAETDFRMAIAPRYEITEELGQGGMGTVYLANDRKLARLVALKVVSPEAAAGIGTEQLLQEIAHVGRLQHPNILPLFDSDERAGHPYYVMPFVRAGSLGALLRARGRLPLAETVSLVRGIARGLACAHAHHLLHCDVKPENVLVQEGHAYVMDFGIARKIHSESLEWNSLRKELDFSAGTPAYVSPEQAAGNRDIDQRSDVYSLACMTYEMLSGRRPFEGKNTEEVVSLRFRAPPPPLGHYAPEVPRATAAAISRAMSIDPEQRPATVDGFADELAHSAHGASAPAAALSIAASRSLAWIRARAGISGPPQLTLPMIGTLNDLRFVVRSLRRQWRFSLGVILVLGLGIGLGLPVLGIADELFLRTPPGVTDPDRVVKLVLRGRSSRDGSEYLSDGLTGLDYSTMTANARTLEAVGGWMDVGLSLGRGADARAINATIASASLFDALGVKPFIGRFYNDAEDREGSSTGPCVVSYRFWRASLGGTADALGRALVIGSVTYTVVGVAPAGFNGLSVQTADVWLPVHLAAPEFQGHDPELWTSDHSSWIRIVGRLKPGVTLAGASAEANVVYHNAELRTRDPEKKGSMFWDAIQSSRSSLPLSSTGRIALWLSGGGVLLLILVAANLVNLFLARNRARARQVAIRLAIGGGRRQLLRLHLLEALLLALCAALFGLVISIPTISAVRTLLMPGIVSIRPALDMRGAALAFLIAFAIGTLIALWSSIQAGRISPSTLLRTAGTAQMAGTRGALRFRRTLLIAQAAIFAVLLSGASGFVLSLRRATKVDVGFDLDSVMGASIPLSVGAVTQEQARELYRQAYERVAALPSVASASLGYMEPWRNNRGNPPASVPGTEISKRQVLFDAATPDYVRTFGLHMVAGRWIDSTDQAGSIPTLVINESLARIYWPHGDALGQCMRIGADSMPCRAIVGVVRDFRVTNGIDGPMTAVYYLPMTQAQNWNFVPRLFVHGRGDPAATAVDVRRAIQAVQAGLPVIDVHPIRRNIAWTVAPLKIGAAVFTAFGLLAAIVAAVGLYSVLSFLVTEQKRGHAIRLALGAPSRDVAIPVVTNAVLTVAGGMAIGFIAVLALGNVFQGMLFHTTLGEPLVVAAVALLGTLVALAAAIAPVRRVLNTDVMEVLRDQ